VVAGAAATARAPDELARRLRREQSLDRRPGLERELSLIDRQIGHLGDAVKRGRATDELLAILEAESDRKKAMARELAALDEGARLASLDGARLTRLLRAGAAENGRRGYRFKGQGTYGRLLVGEAVTSALNRPGSPPPRGGERRTEPITSSAASGRSS